MVRTPSEDVSEDPCRNFNRNTFGEARRQRPQLNYVVISWPLNLKEAADSQTGNISHCLRLTASRIQRTADRPPPTVGGSQPALPRYPDSGAVGAGGGRLALRRHYLYTVAGDGDCVFEVGGEAAVGGGYGPTVVL